MLFYQVGEWFQAYAVGRTRGSIAALMDIRPDAATVLRDGRPLRVDPEDVRVGETIRVRPGERVPLDGTVLVGESALDTAALTGESLPRPVMPGDPAPSGCINLSGLLEIRVDRHYGDSTVARILRLVEEASERKARTEAFITRFARVYTPFVCVSALLLALLPPLLFGGAWGDWVYRALTFLVISCPCALVISVPLSFFGGIGAASRRGVLLKGSNALETLAHVRAVVFDKTGTLTQGAFAVTRVLPAPGLDPDTLLDLAAHAESASTHPLAKAIVAAAPRPVDPAAVTDLREHAGRGVSATVHGRAVLAGNAVLLRAHGIEPPADALALPGTAILLAADGAYAGAILAQDQPKPDAKAAIDALHRAGVRKTVMLTGDNEPAARAVADALGLDECHARLLPSPSSATASTTPPSSPAPTSASPWAPSAPTPPSRPPTSSSWTTAPPASPPPSASPAAPSPSPGRTSSSPSASRPPSSSSAPSASPTSGSPSSPTSASPSSPSSTPSAPSPSHPPRRNPKGSDPKP